MLYEATHRKGLVLELQNHVEQMWSICDYAIKFLTARFLMLIILFLALHISLEKQNTYYSAPHQGQPTFQGL